MRLTFLGTGTSNGIPVIGCDCAVCRSEDPHDRRSRTSAVVSNGAFNLLIDTAPELRVQALANGLRRVDAVLYTHAHADYWTAYKLSFESNEKLIATGTQHVRGLDDHAAVLADPRPAFVAYASDPAMVEHIRATFARHDIEVEQLAVREWVAFLPRADVPVETLAEIVGSTFSNMTLNWVHLDRYPIDRSTVVAFGPTGTIEGVAGKPT